MLMPGEAVVVAVSGGLDSVVLLDLLHRLFTNESAPLHVAHLDHGLRGASAADARFVERLAARYDSPAHVSRLDRSALEAHRAYGREGAAREARQAYLLQVADEVGASRIALAHTADDRTETIIHRLARGTGIAGLRGIPSVRLPFVRPLIEAKRKDILAYALENGLIWRDDASNVDVSFARNRIRHRILPELEAINPRASEAILRASAHAAEADEASAFLVSTIWEGICSGEADGRLTLRRSALSSVPPSVRKLVLREATRRARGDLSGIGSHHIEAVIELAASESSHGELSLPGVHVRVQADDVLLARAPETPVEPWAVAVDVGETEVPDPAMTLRLAIAEQQPSMDREDRWLETADADRVEFPLQLRSRRAGDRFTPLGLDSPIKLKDFLINEQVPYYDRDRLPLLCDRDKIVWAVGVRLSNEVRITEGTRRYLTMHARPRR